MQVLRGEKYINEVVGVVEYLQLGTQLMHKLEKPKIWKLHKSQWFTYVNFFLTVMTVITLIGAMSTFFFFFMSFFIINYLDNFLKSGVYFFFFV